MTGSGAPGDTLRSTPLRLAVLIVILFTLVSLASLGGTYFIIRNNLYAGIRSDLHQQMAAYGAAPSASALAALVANQGAVTDPAQRILTYLGPDDQVYGNVALSRGAEGFLQFDLGPNVKSGTRNYLGLAGNFFGGQLIVAESREPVVALGNTFLDVLILSLLPTYAIVLGGGLLLARRSKARVERITGVLERLISGDLGARIGLAEAGDDLSLISQRIDDMAARQQSSTEALRQVSADIAHDLKTPIQRLSVLLDQLGERPGLDTGAANLAETARGEAERISATFQSLLQIAQIEGGSPKARFEPVDLAEIARTFGEIYAPSAEDSGHIFHEEDLAEPAVVSGDKGLLGQALANLIENALRHTPAGSDITVALLREATAITLEVRDSGPGIPKEEREKVLRRLYRLERSRTTPGSGLGLSLVSVIAELHDAALVLEDNGPGLRVRLRFPRAQAQAAA